MYLSVSVYICIIYIYESRVCYVTQTHDNLEHLAMMERILGTLPYRMTRKSRCVSFLSLSLTLSLPLLPTLLACHAFYHSMPLDSSATCMLLSINIAPFPALFSFAKLEFPAKLRLVIFCRVNPGPC